MPRSRNRSKVPHPAPDGEGGELTLVRDRHGLLWLCPRGVDENSDLAAQGCWRSDGPTPADIVRAANAQRKEEP